MQYFYLREKFYFSIVKSGAWYAYEGNKIGQGRENAKQYLRDNPEVCNAVDAKVRAHYGFGGAVVQTEEKTGQTDAPEAKAGAKSSGKTKA